MLALACFLGKLNELGYEEGQTLIDGIDNYADNSDGNEHDTRILKNCFCAGPCNLLDFASEVFPKLLKALAETLEGIPVGILRLSGLRLGLFGLSDFLGRSKLGVIGALLDLFSALATFAAAEVFSFSPFLYLPTYFVSLWRVCFLQKRQYLFISSLSGVFFLFLTVL